MRVSISSVFHICVHAFGVRKHALFEPRLQPAGPGGGRLDIQFYKLSQHGKPCLVEIGDVCLEVLASALLGAEDRIILQPATNDGRHQLAARCLASRFWLFANHLTQTAQKASKTSFGGINCTFTGHGTASRFRPHHDHVIHQDALRSAGVAGAPDVHVGARRLLPLCSVLWVRCLRQANDQIRQQVCGDLMP